MVVRVSNKGIHRYKYLRRKIFFSRRKKKDEDISFGEVLTKIQGLKKEGIISILSDNSSIVEAMKNYK